MTSSMRTLLAFAALSTAAFASAQQITVSVDNKPVNFMDTTPRMVNGRVMVPLRGVFEEMGATVQWDPATRMVTAMRGAQDVRLRVGDRTATINGQNLNLDVPAMIIGSSTMVPIRFVSEALGAQVGWMAATNHVSIMTSMASGNQTVTTPPQRLRRVIVQDNTVIPVTLDHTLTSADARRGDTFTATVNTNGNTEYSSIPLGTKVEGRIAAAQKMSGNQPGILELEFTRLRFPNGRSVTIDGELISLDDKYVTRNGNGVMTAKSGSNRDQRVVYAGYGAGAGLLVGLLGKKPLEGALLGGALGYLLGQVQKDQQGKPSDVRLDPGTQFGVRVARDVVVSWPEDGGTRR